MNPSPNRHHVSQGECRSGTGEDPLRLIANLPAPEGLADRVRAGLRAASRPGRLLLFREPLRPAGGWLYSAAARGAAAAAIVGIVAGGGWTIYSRVQPAPAAKVIVLPAGVAPGSGFSQAGAKRVPQTLQGPVLTHPVEGAAQQENVVSKTPATAVPNRTVHKRKKLAAPAVSPVQ